MSHGGSSALLSLSPSHSKLVWLRGSVSLPWEWVTSQARIRDDGAPAVPVWTGVSLTGENGRTADQWLLLSSSSHCLGGSHLGGRQRCHLCPPGTAKLTVPTPELEPATLTSFLCPKQTAISGRIQFLGCPRPLRSRAISWVSTYGNEVAGQES